MAGGTFCNYDADFKALTRAADKTGVNFNKYASAVLAAVTAIDGGEYDRKDLIPEVTREVRAHMTKFNTQIKDDRARFCTTLQEQISSFLKTK